MKRVSSVLILVLMPAVLAGQAQAPAPQDRLTLDVY